MKIEVFNRPVSPADGAELLKEVQRVELIIEGLGTLEGIQTAYYTYGEDQLPEWVLEVLDQEGLASLPLTAVNDKVVKKGQFLSNEEFTHFTGVSFTIEEEGHEHHHHHHGGCSCGHHH